MTLPLAKVCDAADWLDPEVARIVAEELREAPRFHRKQWEFAVVFRALAALGFLDGRSSGLALAAGRERLLYALLPRVRRLLATDLYAADTSWAESRTSDPDRFVREGAPFPVDFAGLEVRRMDMRALSLAEASFDFAYSCCAIEHIGGEADFDRHLAEVHRVLRPGGVYVFTTEFLYGAETIEDPNNYVFGTEALSALLARCPLRGEPECWSAIWPHRANFPLPEDVAAAFGSGGVGELLGHLPHVQLMRGDRPHSSAVFVLRKEGTGAGPVAFPGLADARRFLDGEIAEYRRLIERSVLDLAPTAYLDGGRSPYVGAAAAGGPPPGRTVFHTRYAWLGAGRRRFTARLLSSHGSGTLELRVHRQRTFGRGSVELAAARRLELGAAGGEGQVEVDLSADSSYAFLGEFVGGACRFDHIGTTVSPAT